ncbi:MAG: TetR/AcrR family transcriptional regulator [Rhizobiaceae bacterium]
MQSDSMRRSNQERTDATRAALVAAARRLFTGAGYAATGTPEIVGAAGVTRGALYHHFADKQTLFRAVVEQEAAAVASEIERAAPDATDAIEALRVGGRAYLEAMRMPGRTRLLLLDGPAVLGRALMDEIDARHGNRALREGLTAAMRAGSLAKMPVGPLTALLGAMFDRAALAVQQGEALDDQLAVMDAIVAGLARQT